MTTKNVNESKKRKGRPKKREYPTLALEPKGNILKLITILFRYGGSATRKELKNVKEINKSMLGLTIASAKQYGLVIREGGRLSLSNIGKEICSTNTETEMKTAIIKALLNVNYFKRLVKEKDFPDIPIQSILRKIMISYGVPEKDASNVAGVFRRTLSSWNLIFEDLKELKVEPKDYAPIGEAEITEEERDRRGFDEGLIIGYIIGLTSEQKVKENNEKLIALLDSIRIDKVQTYVKLIKEQLKEGFIQEDEALRFLSKKFKELAKPLAEIESVEPKDKNKKKSQEEDTTR